MTSFRAVIDTNVLHAGLYSASGASFQLLRMIEIGKITPILSTALLYEYEEVLIRHREVLGLTRESVDVVLDAMCKHGEARNVYFLWRPRLPDPKDDHILELAVAAGSAPIVTHNTRDYAAAQKFGVRIIKPSALLKELK